MRKLINILFGLTLTGMSVFSQDFLPERFRDYRVRGEELFADELPPIIGEKFVFQPHIWDVDKDSIEDVVEFYIITGFSFNGFKTLKEPKYYFFDFNGDGNFSDEEKRIDPSMDGLNGNEKPLYMKPKEVKEVSRREYEL